MRVLDKNDNELKDYDLAKGYLVDDKILAVHHKAVKGTKGKYHLEVIKEYPNGGKDVKVIWDEEPREAKEAWDEYESIQRFIPFTKEELAEIKAREAEAEKIASAPKNYEMAEMIEELKTSASDTEGALVDLGEMMAKTEETASENSQKAGENENALVDLADYIAQLEERVAELEAKKEEK